MVDYDHSLLGKVSVAALSNPEAGIEIVGQASNFKQCVDEITRSRIRKAGIDAFIISVHLPGKSGLALANDIKKLYPNAKIIMTIDENTRHLASQVEQVADDYLVKPFYITHLFSVLRQLATPADTGAPKLNSGGLSVDYDDAGISQPESRQAKSRLTPDSPTEEIGGGHSRVVVNPVPSYGMEKEHVLRREEELAPVLMDSTLALIYSAKGGDGKSTVATNVAAALAKHADTKKVCLVDLDLDWPCVATELDLLEHRKTIMDIKDDLIEGTLTEEKLRDVLVVHPPTGLYVLLGPLRPEEAMDINEKHIKALYGYLRQMFDIIIIDAGVAVDNPTVQTMLDADKIILVATPALSSLQKNVNFISLLKRIKVPLNRVHLVVNRHDPKNQLTPQRIGQALQLEVEAIIPFVPFELQETSVKGELLVFGGNKKVRDAFLEAASLIYPYFRRPDDYAGRRPEDERKKKKPLEGLITRWIGGAARSE